MKNIIYLLILNFSISCHSQVSKNEVVNYLNNSILINASYSAVNLPKAKVVFPNNINAKFKSIIDVMISKDTEAKNLVFCNQYLINYKVKTLYVNFICIEKSISSMFCDNYDDIDFEVFNLYIANDGNVYRLEIKKDAYLNDTISKFVVTSDVDCNYDSTVINYLMIDNRKYKLFISKDKVCNDVIDLEINSLDLIITKL